MKLSARAFRIQWDVHAWVGVLASLVLFVVFFFGLFALFREEIAIWQDPRLHAVSERRPTSTPSYSRALEQVAARVAIPEAARLRIIALEEAPALAVTVSSRDKRHEESVIVDTESGRVLEERSRLGEELYMLHFFYRVPHGLEATGLFAVALLVALLGGVLLHLKNLWRQRWQFRQSLRLRVSASDAHKVLGIFGLPFSAIVAWSGALLTLGGLLYWAMAAACFDGDVTRVTELRGRPVVVRRAEHRPAPGLPLDVLVEQAKAALHTEEPPRYVTIDHYGDANAFIRVEFDAPPFTDRSYVYLDAVTGQELGRAKTTATSRFERMVFDLHFARFGGLLLKVTYGLLALFTCVVILTGNIVWLERRDPSRRRLGNRLLERLTLGFAGGAVLGTAAAFAANRALPHEVWCRADLEIGALLFVWALTSIGLLLVRVPIRRALATMSATTALLLLLVVGHDLVAVRTLSPPLAAVDGALTLLAVVALGTAVLARGRTRVRAASDAAAHAKRTRARSSSELEVRTGESPCALE